MVERGESNFNIRRLLGQKIQDKNGWMVEWMDDEIANINADEREGSQCITLCRSYQFYQDVRM